MMKGMSLKRITTRSDERNTDELHPEKKEMVRFGGKQRWKNGLIKVKREKKQSTRVFITRIARK